MMKKIVFIIIVAVAGLSSDKSFANCDPNYYNCNDPARVIGTALGIIATDAIFGRQHHSHRHYRHNNGGYYYGDEYENARRAGYEEARRRHFEEMRWRQEETRRQRIENARLEGEVLYQQRHGGRRW